MPTQPSSSLETFPNPQPDLDYTIRMSIPEFTCLCPKTGQPDFATLDLEYVPDKLCVELKSLKLYIWSFRDRGAFHEAVTNEIADRLASATRALPAAHGEVQCARRYLDERCRRAPTGRLAAAGGRGTAMKSGTYEALYSAEYASIIRVLTGSMP